MNHPVNQSWVTNTVLSRDTAAESVNTYAAQSLPATEQDSAHFSGAQNESDQSFSTWGACKKLAQGVISPITGMLSSVPGFLMGAGMIAGFIGLSRVVGHKTAARLGLGLGAVFTGITGYHFAGALGAAKTGKDVENSFYHLGEMLVNLVPTVAGLKGLKPVAALESAQATTTAKAAPQGNRFLGSVWDWLSGLGSQVVNSFKSCWNWFLGLFGVKPASAPLPKTEPVVASPSTSQPATVATPAIEPTVPNPVVAEPTPTSSSSATSKPTVANKPVDVLTESNTPVVEASPPVVETPPVAAAAKVPGAYLDDVSGLVGDLHSLSLDAGMGINDYQKIQDILKAAQPDKALIEFFDVHKRYQHSADLFAKIEPVLKKHGLTPTTAGEVFDPALYRVANEIHTTDPSYIGKVHQTLAPGYTVAETGGTTKTILQPAVEVFVNRPVTAHGPEFDAHVQSLLTSLGYESGKPLMLDPSHFKGFRESNFQRFLAEHPLESFIEPMAPGVKPSAGSPWSASMTADEAAAWAKDSVLQDTYHHGTQPWSQAELIGKGFDPSRPILNGATLDVGEGAYMALSESSASAYGPTVLQTRVNVSQPAKITNPTHWDSFRYYFEEAASAYCHEHNLPKDTLVALNNRLLKTFFTSRGYDAVYTPYSGKAGCGYVAVFDPKNIAIVKPGA